MNDIEKRRLKFGHNRDKDRMVQIEDTDICAPEEDDETTWMITLGDLSMSEAFEGLGGNHAILKYLQRSGVVPRDGIDVSFGDAVFCDSEELTREFVSKFNTFERWLQGIRFDWVWLADLYLRGGK